MKAAKPSLGLPGVTGTQFSRAVDRYAKEIFEDKKALSIKIRGQVKAVALNPAEYDELISIREKFEVLVREKRDRALDAARSEFQELYTQIASRESADAMRSMINVISADLAGTYKPVGAETK
jgi:hypothetical protein